MAILPETITSLPDVSIKGAFQSPITGVSIDTRNLNAGDLFVAFVGSKVDGHDYIPKAISRGASAVMASTSWNGCEGWEASIPLIMTEDPVKSLADLATEHRKLFDVPLIAITGTNGKTSTKNLLSHILRKRYCVLSTDGNFNNHIGLPLTLLKLNESHDMAVIEMGASKQGDIEYLCNIAQPNQGVITNIGLAHTEFFHDIETIKATKGELFHYLRLNNGRAYINIDDPRVAEIGKTCPNHIAFSFHEEVERRFNMSGPDLLGCYSLHFRNYSSRLGQAGKAIVLNAAAAAAIALQNGIRFDQLQNALETYPGEIGRMQHEEIGGVHFYNDAYNANPASVQAGFETMAEIRTPSRKILIFADMLELGVQSVESHIKAAEQMLETGFDHIILYGNEVNNCSKYLNDKGFTSLHYSKDKPQSLQHFLNVVQQGDLVYLKGSRGMLLEDYVNAYKEAI
jgi:UDP-N-acetylmuramoyl-tripeptide--D-alanyl-D-alanine ligase